MEFVLHTIGIIHSPCAELPELPIQPPVNESAGEVEVFPDFVEGLLDIEPYDPEFNVFADVRTGWYAQRSKN